LETRANHLLVGSFVLLSVVGLLIFVVWFFKSEYDTAYEKYELPFPGGITGISEGSPVYFQGVSVGQVLEVELSETAHGTVLVTIQVKSDTPVKTDSIGSIDFSGFIKGNYILLSQGSDNADKPTEVNGVIPSLPTKPALMSQLIEAAPNYLDKVDHLLLQLSEIFSTRNIQAFNNIIANVDELTIALTSNLGEVETILEQISATMGKVQVLTDQFSSTSQNLDADLDQLLKEVHATSETLNRTIAGFEQVAEETARRVTAALEDFGTAASSVKRLSEETENLVRENREPINEFTQVGLYELTLTLQEFRHLVSSLGRVAQELERDPARFIFGDQQAGFTTGNK